MTDRDVVRAILDRINNAWLKGLPDQIAPALHDLFHPEMVIKGPSFETVGAGRDACAKSYEEFARQAVIRDCRLWDPIIDVAGDTAVAIYSWDMTYELAGQSYQESGRDLFVFTRSANGWQAVWRALLPSAVP